MVGRDGPLTGVMMIVEAAGIAGERITTIFLVFIPVPAESLVVLPLFVGMKGVDGLCNH